MKQTKMMLSLAAFIVGFTVQSFAQEVLPEVKVVAVRYKYLTAVDNKEVAQPVKLLERKAAAFDVKNSEFYEDEYDDYFISFFIPDGEILAAYDKDGKLIRTAEKYKNVAVPLAVRQGVMKRFPQWTISKDVYLVNYQESGVTTKVYKLLLENGSKRIRVKANEQGEIIE